MSATAAARILGREGGFVCALEAGSGSLTGRERARKRRGSMTTASRHESRVYFSDVARAHWRWDCVSEGDGSDSGPLKDEFDNALAAFEKTVDGRKDAVARVMDSYWCQQQASGVALVEVSSSKPHGPLRSAAKRLGFWHPIPEYRVYRESDWVTVEYAKLASLLHECDVLAIKARWGLEGLHQAVVMPWLMAVEEHILGFIERDWRRRKQPQETSQSQAGRGPTDGESAEIERASFYNAVLLELNRIEDYYQQAGEKRARLHFVSSMLTFGVLIVIALGFLSAGVFALFGLLDLHDSDIRRFYASMAAGAIGAIVSVLMRMSGVHGSDFKIDHELGSDGVRRLGAFRPLVGAVSGVVVALLVQTTLVASQSGSVTTAFFAVVAFLAGFSERWTKVMLDGAMRTVDRPGSDAQAAPPLTHPNGSRVLTAATDAKSPHLPERV